MKYRILGLLLITILLSGCESTQKVIGFWADPEAASMGPYKKVFVIVLSPNQDANYFLETEIGNTLSSRGYQVVRFNDAFPPNFEFTESFKREQFAAAIKETGCDAVLTLALLDSKTVETYHPGTSYYPVSYGYYGSYYNYYSYYYPVVSTPGYYSVDKTFYLETNAYDLASDKLLWSVQSEAKNPANLEDGFRKYSEMLTNYLKGKGLNKK
jgi:hypothetical protein